jgi:hypothetical protein
LVKKGLTGKKKETENRMHSNESQATDHSFSQILIKTRVSIIEHKKVALKITLETATFQ